MKRLASYVQDAWIEGQGAQQPLCNPATSEPIAETSTEGLDFAAALGHARDVGGRALRKLTFAERGEVLRQMARVIHEGREDLLALAIANGGNTRSDAKFDVDGASATLAAYADLGAALGDRTVLADGEPVQVGRTARYQGQHVLVPRRGVAVHVNAFNFPAWGLAEKAATALLAGMPVVSKPATATAMVAHRMMQLFADAGVLPAGSLSLVCGSAGDMLSHLGGQDVLAFTGSSTTASTLRAGQGVVERSVHINVEADSLNAAVLAPDVEPGSETWDLFVADVIKDMRQKAGQKCTAIRRVFVPHERLDDVIEALRERLAEIVVGNPADPKVAMGPLASAAQQRDVREGIARLSGETEALFGGDGAVEPVGVAAGKGYFVAPVLRLCREPRAARVLNDHEVFGPVATVATYSGEPGDGAELVQLGQGGLVCSAYSDDRDWYAGFIPVAAAYTGRIYMGSAKVAAQSAGPGTVLPQLVHGGPGRAGGGEELGGARGMRLYQQRCALQGDKGILKTLL